jgi:hypothetical protein
MTGVLLLHRDAANFALEGRFSFVKRLPFETTSDVLKSMISQS